MDPFDDDVLFETSTTSAVRARGKFQPKVKFRSKKGTSQSVLTEAKEKVGILSSGRVDTAQLVMPHDVANDKLEDSVDSILAISAIKCGEQSLKACEDRPGVPEDVRNSKAFFSEVVSSRVELSLIGESSQEADVAGVDADSVIDSKPDPAIASTRISSTQEISAPKQSDLFVSTKEKCYTLFASALDTVQSFQLGDAGKAAEVDMIQHLDPFDDVLYESAAHNACAGQRFQPKTKPQNRKGTCIVDTSTLPTMHPSTSISMESFYVGAHGRTDQVDLPLATSAVLGSREPSKDNEFTSYVPFSDNTSNLGVAIVASDLEFVVPEENGEFPKSAGENADIFAGLESLDDFHTQSSDTNEHLGNTSDIATASEGRAYKFQPKPKMKNGKEKPSTGIPHMESASSMPLQADDMVSCETAYVQEGSIPGSHGVDVLGCSSTRCYGAIPSNQPSIIAGNAQETDFVELSRLDSAVLADVVYSEDISMSGKVDGKSGAGEASEASDPLKEPTSTVNDVVGGAKMSKQLRKQSAQQLVVEPAHETDELNKYKDNTDECRSKSLLPPRKRRRCSTFSKAVEDGKTSRQIRKQLVQQPLEELGEKSTDVNDSTYESPNTCAKIYMGGVDESKASDPPRKHKTSTTCEEVGDRQTRHLRKRSAQRLVDELSSEFNDINASTDEPFSADTDECEDNDDKFREDIVSKKKRAPRKPKKLVSENKKSVKKRKSASDTPDDSTIKPPKKFARSSCKNRSVDKVLLDTPEDEIDPLKVPIKDLLRLVDYRKRLQSKETLKSRSQLTNQSADNPLYKEASHDEDSLNMGVGEEFDDEQTTSRPTSGTYVNYQSFMYKTPSTRWSKQDTELFYEAVRQFGTDFSMIQQRFPGRTRRQVMLKFKREEREHRLQLDEAVTNRAKDHSHFEYVMQRLQQAAAQAKEQNENESTGVAGEEDVEEMMHDANDEATKSEADEKIKNVEADVAKAQGPLESEEIFDDPDRWNNYNY